MAKYRNGWVSNSSSSSFIIIGKELFSLNDAPKNANIMAAGCYLGDGQDVFTIDEGMRAFLTLNPHIASDLTFYLVEDSGGEGGLAINKKKISDGSKVFSFEKDYYCSESVEDLQTRYGKL